MSSPVTARSGIWWAGAGMLVATLVTFLYPGMSNYPAHRRGDPGRQRTRVVERQARRDDGHAADDCAIQRYRRRRGRGHRRRRALRLGVANRGAVEHPGPTILLWPSRRHHRRRLFQRQLIAFGKLQGVHQQDHSASRAADLQPAAARGRVVTGAIIVLHSMGGPSPDFDVTTHVTLLFVAGSGARCHHDAADRWRRHAGGHLALQRAHRPCGRLRRLRARQRRHDHRWHGGRLCRHAAHPAHGPRDEPLARQRAVLGVRRIRVARRPAKSAEASSPSRPPTSAS